MKRVLSLTLSAVDGEPLTLLRGDVVDTNKEGTVLLVELHAPWNTIVGRDKIWIERQGTVFWADGDSL